MKDQYYIKDKKAEIYKLVTVGTDEDGFDINRYKKLSKNPLWCYTRQLSQEQVFTSMSIGQEETRLFIFNYRNDVEISDFVLYRGKTYQITRADTKDDYTRGFICVCEKLQRCGDFTRQLRRCV